MSESQLPNVYKRLLEAQGHIVAPRQESRFRGGSRSAEQILEAAKPACREFGLVLVTNERCELVGERYRIRATAKVYNVDDPTEFISASASTWEGEISAGLDASQVSGKAGSYAKKYALQDLFAIDDTKDADFEEPAKKASPATPAKPASVEAPARAPSDEQQERIIELGEALKYTPKVLEARMALNKTSKQADEFIFKLEAQLEREKSGEAS